ncbi:MAG: DsbA family oxidoreductase [Betaproteobacteria bacterium]|nr:DsbA family oxidoreductase [Betaproteobacteria bacterium]
MNQSIDIIVVSDVVCPWCWIGKRNLESALARWQSAGHAASVHWQPFQLNPQLPDEGMPRSDYLLWKFGRSDPSIIYERVSHAASQVGLKPDFGGIKHQPNTTRAHALIAAAGENETLQEQLVEQLFAAYFHDHRAIGDLDVLYDIGKGCGLTAEEIERAQSPKALELVREQSLAWSERGIGGVPFFIVDQRYGLSGAQPASELFACFEQALIPSKS